MGISVAEAMLGPSDAADHLLRNRGIHGLEVATGRRGVGGSSILELTLRPVAALERVGYPKERVRIVLVPDGEVLVFPLGDRGRRFKHRNPGPISNLCFQYIRDEPALRWLPEDGLEDLITIVHRHLMFEEAWRRSDRWPCEDAPHGDDAGSPHPIKTRAMREHAHRWARPK
jgi:hypothetical protein